MKFLLVPFLLLASLALAKDKPKDSDYQQATLVSFRTGSTGSSCNGNVNAQENGSGGVSGTTNSSCVDNQVRIYTIRVGDQTLMIEPARTGKQKAVVMGTFGYSAFFAKGSVLRDQLPGAKIEVRSDGSGMYIRVGKKESKFTIVAAQ